MPEAGPILLLGGTGQIGWELHRTLGPLGRIRAAGRSELDLASPDAIRRVVRDLRPGLIVNAVAYTAVDRAEQDEDLARAVNGTAPGVLAEEAKRLGIALVHYSTDYVFDGKAASPYLEDDPAGPLGAYGRSKLAGEQAIAATGGAHLIFRTSWVYALRGANFLLTMRRLACEREELRVVADQSGAPTWARSVAEATATVLAHCHAPADRGPLAERSGLYHMSAGGETSWHGFAEEIVASMRDTGEPVKASTVTPIATEEYPTPAARPAWSVLDNTKLAGTFGVSIPDWREQLALCLGG